jgi:hypothetical protein
MKKLALMLLLLLPTTAFAASTKPNPADFTLTVHVISSRFNCAGGCSQILETTTGTQPVELTRASNTVLGVLAPGNYPARLSISVRVPKADNNTYDIYRAYDLLMPDGTVRTYGVTGLGPTSTNP